MSLKGLTHRINLISISADERFLCACAENQFLCVWDLGSGEVVFCQKLPAAATVMKWLGYKREKHYPTYDIVLGHGSQLISCKFVFQQDKVQWGLQRELFTMPPGGSIIRTFTCVDTSVDRCFVYVGTTGGEMLVFRRDTEVYRACIPVCSNGVQSILTLLDDSVLIGGGDGTGTYAKMFCIVYVLYIFYGIPTSIVIHPHYHYNYCCYYYVVTKLIGGDMEWRASMRVRFDSAVSSLSLSCNESEFLASCTDGTIYRGLVRNLANNIVNESHTSAISSIAFSSINNEHQQKQLVTAGDRRGDHSACPDNPTIFATGTKSGEIRLWDLADYSCIAACRYQKSGEVQCMSILTNDRLISGWSDGMIRCNDLHNLQQQFWFIPAAHRGANRSTVRLLRGC